jgi:hypothetical protein
LFANVAINKIQKQIFVISNQLAIFETNKLNAKK